MAKLIHKFKRSYFLKMSGDGKTIAQVNATQINLFNAETFEQIAQFKEMKNSNVVFSNNNSMLCAKTTDRKLGIYDLGTKQLIKTFSIKKNTQSQDDGFCFSPDDKKIINLVYGCEKTLLSYISVIDIETMQEKRYFEGENNVFRTVQYVHQKQKFLISGFHRPKDEITENISFYMWFDWKTGESEFTDTLYIDTEIFVYAEKLDKIVVCKEFGIKRIEIINENKTLDLSEKQAQKITLSNDNQTIAIMCKNKVELYNFSDFRQLTEIEIDGWGDVSFSPDDKLLLVGTWNNGYVVDLQSI